MIFIAYIIHQKTDREDVKVVAPSSFQQTNTQVDISPSASANTTSGATPPASTPSGSQSGKYKDGQYTGDVTDAFYGNFQVQIIISAGKISDVKFLQYPNDRETSIEINNQSNPILKQEAIAAQSAEVDTVTGATQSSDAFRQSLKSALSKAV